MKSASGSPSQPQAPVEVALDLAKNGIRCFPVKRDKKPLVKWMEAATTDQDQIRKWWKRWPDAMVAIPTGGVSGVFVVDLDVNKQTGAPIGESSLKAAGLADCVRHVPCVRTPSGGAHFYFKHPGKGFGNTAGQIGPGIDTRGDGGYVVAPGSFNGSGAYVPAQTIDWRALPDLPMALRLALNAKRTKTAQQHVSLHASWADTALREELARVQAASEGARNDTLNRAAFSLGQIVAGGALNRDHVFARLLEAAIEVGLPESEARGTIDSGMTAGAREPRGPKGEQSKEDTNPGGHDGHTGADDLRPPAFSDEALAIRFARLHTTDLRYVAAQSKWHIWSGNKWLPDTTLGAFDLARSICRAAASECTKPRHKTTLASAKTVSAVERLAKSDRLIAATVEQWDANADVLNTPWSGT